ncbi:MAG: hypothetical protein LUE14_05790 [Clostridiales bacterium]|nr:hypothetical protein [Clostridiales bacterium]
MKKELPESALDFLIELWARERNLKIISIEKIPKEEGGTIWHEEND